MGVQKTALFQNLFTSNRITPARLYNFGNVVLGALKAANDKKQFDDIIATLTAALAALFKELSDIDTGLTNQKIDTRTVDELIQDFITFMSENEAIIAKALGGKTSAGYLSFYPKKQSEYSKANKTTMPVLTSRVAAAAEQYAGKLDADMVEELSSFKPLFIEKYGAQQLQITSVGQNRKERGTAFLDAQMALTSAVYTVGAAFPGNPEKCQAFFPFKMLYRAKRRKRYTFTDILKEGENRELLNYILNKTAEIACANTGTNAAYAIWLAALPTEPMPADAYVINVNDAPLTLKAEKLGDLEKKPFVMVKNLSAVNSCAYEITFVGVKKAIKGAVDTTDEDTTEIMVAS